MKRLIAVTALLACLVVPTTSPAFSFPETVSSHDCRKPYKPYKFTSDFELDQFKSEVKQYKQCIEDYVQDQEDAIRKHREMANEAVDEWNDYVQHELN